MLSRFLHFSLLARIRAPQGTPLYGARARLLCPQFWTKEYRDIRGGTHTKALLGFWRRYGGPPIASLITTQPPVRRSFQGIPVVVNDFTPGSLDLIILSSHAFEREMAGEMRRRHPDLPFIAISNPHLSNFPPDRKPDERTLLLHAYEDFRCLSSAQWIDTFRPDLFICTHVIYFQELLQASHLPKSLIYYSFELPGGPCGYELQSRHWEEHNSRRERINLAIFPEKHRKDYYCDLFDFGSVLS